MSLPTGLCYDICLKHTRKTFPIQPFVPSGIATRAVIITRYLFKEIFTSLAGIVLVLLLIALSGQLVGLFSQVAAGTLHLDTVLKLFGLYNLSIITFILPISLYLAVLMALSRLYHDSEMAALFACGIGPGTILRVVLLAAFILALVQGLFALYLAPWAEEQGELLKLQSRQTADIEGITPGRFKELPQGMGVIYVESISDDYSEIRNIFVQAKNNARQSIIIAERGYIEQDKNTGDRFLMLEKGHRYEGQPGDDNYTMLDFARHGLRIQEKEVKVMNMRKWSVPTRQLLASKDPLYITELQWRISTVLMCFVLAILAVPLSRTSHRQGHYTRMAIAILLYLLISSLLNAARSWLQSGQIPPWIGLWWVHLLVVVVAILLILRQTGYRYYLPWRRRGIRNAHS